VTAGGIAAHPASSQIAKRASTFVALFIIAVNGEAPQAFT
jgi:hypothetical protein